MSTAWFKSTFSGGEQACVEVAFRPDTVLVRDDKYTGPEAEQPIITIQSEEWAAVLDLAVRGQSGETSGVCIQVHDHGGVTMTGSGVALEFDSAEWLAFTQGVQAREFVLG